MKILITGNPTKGLAQSMHGIWPDASFVSRANGWDLDKDQRRKDLAQLALEYDVFVNNSALWQFQQTLLLKDVYQHEKKSLRDFCNSLGLMSTWGGGPKVSLLSVGSLSNVQHKHPTRTCMELDQAAQYVKWMVDQPAHLAINELSIDPIQENVNGK